MSRRFAGIYFHLLIFAVLFSGLGLSAQEGEAEGGKKYDETPPVKATLIIGQLPRDGELVGRTKTKVVAKINFKTVAIDIDTLVAVDFFTDYTDYDVEVLLREGKYKEAADKIVSAYAGTISYLDLPENNAVEPLLNAASFYLKAAEQDARKTGVFKLTPDAEENYKRAFRVFRWVAVADWHVGSQIADLKSLFCLLRMEKTDVAEKAFAELGEPDYGDAAFGIYWLVSAYIKYQKQEVRDAIESAVRSLVFETKDIDVFPEALFLSAQCYEDMFEYHRARDTYFELASLFERTQIGEIAFNRLKFIMDQGFTKDKEDVSIESVFFGSAEDMEVKVKEFIERKLEDDRLRKEQEERRRKEKEIEEQIL